MINACDVRVDRANLSTHLTKIDQVKAWKDLFGMDPTVGKLWRSPLRDDKKAGCSFFVNSQGVILFNDFAAGRKYNIVDMLKEHRNIGLFAALEALGDNFLSEPITYSTARKKLVQVKINGFSETELEYWNSYGITERTLKLFNVFSVSRVYVDKKLKKRSTRTNPIFAYFYPNSGNIKTYRPLTKEREDKWLGNATQDDINGWNQIPYFGELLVITKSLKDVMTLYELGVTSVAPQGEGMDIPINILQSYYDKVVILYDNDGDFATARSPGTKGKGFAERLSRKYDVPMCFIPDEEPKDISDYYFKYGKEKTLWLLSQLGLHTPTN